MRKGILFTAMSALLYGSIGFFGVCLLDGGLSVTTMLFWRFLFSCLLLLPLLPIFISRPLSSNYKKGLFHLFVLGGISQGLSATLYFEASKFIGTGLAMVIFFTYPIFVVALSFFLKKIPISRATQISLFLIIIGCTMIAGGGELAANFDLRGLFLALMSGLSYGFYIFYSKELSMSLPPVLSTLSVCLGTTFTLALYMFLGSNVFIWPQGQDAWLLLSLFALIGTVLPVLLLLIGMKYISASFASIISVLEPVAVLGVGALALKESLKAMQLVGTLVILSATILVYLMPKKSENIS